jgi:hypothetical protein
MVKGVHAVELAPAGKQPVTERRDPARQAGSRDAGSAWTASALPALTY